MTWVSGEQLTDELNEFLHGKCIDYLRNHYTDGDEIIVITTDVYDEDWDMELETLVHVLILRNDEYHDVRGSTNDFDLVLADFYIENEEKVYTKGNLKEMQSFLDVIKS